MPVHAVPSLYAPAPSFEPGGFSATAVPDSGGELQPDNYGLDAVLVADSVIVVADRTAVKWFAPDGALLRRVGRKGAGPGEFTQIVGLCRFAGDSLLVFDQDYRVSTISPDGAVVRTIRPDGTPQPDGCFDSGAFLVRGRPAPSGEGLADYHSVSSAGVHVADFPALPAPTSAAPPRTPLFAFRGDTLVVADGWEPAVTLYDARGNAVRRVVSAASHRRVDADSPLVVRAEAPQGGSRDAAVEGGRVEVPMFRHLQIDAAGRIGLLTLWRRSREVEWTFLGSEGVVRRLRFPADASGRWTLFEAGEDSALVGFESSEVGVRVAKVPLRRLP